jgi:hypothetical protein
MRGAACALGLWLAAGTARAAEAPICTDRPAKANSVCTVRSGRFQVETSALDWTRIDQGPTGVEMLLVGSSLVKYGLTGRSDLQIGLIPLVRIRARGESQTLSGFGDVLVRYKHRLTSEDAPVQVAIIPFVKLPTARRGLGNRKVEGGIALPLSIPAGKLSVTLGPELDVLANADGRGRHVALVNVLNVAGTIAPRLTLVGELWSNLNFDPNGTSRQASADAALAYALSTEFQLDAGVNAGLTRHTPDVEIYAGLSVRL